MTEPKSKAKAAVERVRLHNAKSLGNQEVLDALNKLRKHSRKNLESLGGQQRGEIEGGGPLPGVGVASQSRVAGASSGASVPDCDVPEQIVQIFGKALQLADGSIRVNGSRWPDPQSIDPVGLARVIVASMASADVIVGIGEVERDFAEASSAGIGDAVPPFSEAPRDQFVSIRESGEPENFLRHHYGPWLQPGKECLDRPKLMELDEKLLRALQQRATRNPEKLSSPLSEIFPSTAVARRNEIRYIRTHISV